MNLSVVIVELPNVEKSTLFNALLKELTSQYIVSTIRVCKKFS